ncbi:hypothetical protein D3C71_1756460 [compost metagenome]
MADHSLKRHSVIEVQENLAKALAELTGKDVEIEIGLLEFEFSSLATPRTKFTVTMNERTPMKDGVDEDGRF